MPKKTLEDLALFYNNKENWRPPSLSTVAKFMGYKSKTSAKNILKKLSKKYDKEDNEHVIW